QRAQLITHVLQWPGVGLPVVEEADGLPDSAENALAFPKARSEVHTAQVLDQDLHSDGAVAAVWQEAVRQVGELDGGRAGVVGALLSPDPRLRGIDPGSPAVEPVDVHPGTVMRVIESQRGDRGPALPVAAGDLDVPGQAQQSPLE